jgi:nicotinamide-nucleotide amidase
MQSTIKKVESVKLTENIASLLRERGATLAVAESCTGGRIVSAFTALAGASEYFLGGVVAYSNYVKIDVLGVGCEVLEHHGAVSCEVAEAMAEGVRRITCADFTIATTGIAGPGGGSAEKPVGTVWMAVASPDGVVSKLFNFNGSREEIMNKAVTEAIEMLRRNYFTRKMPPPACGLRSALGQ